MAGCKVAVIFGGPGAEHEVSRESALSVISNLREAGCEVQPVRVERSGEWCFPADAERPVSAAQAAVRLEGARVDVAFPVVHGELGEDGRLCGLLRVLGIPLVGSGVRGSAYCIDKARCKKLLEGSGLELAASVRVERWRFERDASAALAAARALSFPCVVKPIDHGSSVAVHWVQDVDVLPSAVERVFRETRTEAALVEEAIEGQELTVAVLGNPETGLTALPPILIRPRGRTVFDYEAKYTPGEAEEICPAPLPGPLLERVARDALRAFEVLECRGIARADFVVAAGRPFFLEMNTMPGFTAGSLVPLAARTAGWSMPAFFLHLVELARSPRAALRPRARRQSA